jgi:hypothetical protein
MEPDIRVSTGKIGEVDTEKRDYRNIMACLLERLSPSAHLGQWVV